MQRLRSRGFSLIELMVTLVLLAALLAMAVPTMSDWLAKSRQRNLATAIDNAITRARTEAIKRNTRVTACVSADQKTCTQSGGWQHGWIIYVNTDDSKKLEASDTIIHYESGDNFSRTTATGNQPVKNYLSFISNGMPRLLGGAAFQAGTITVCAPGQNALAVVMAATGRTRIEQTSTLCS